MSLVILKRRKDFFLLSILTLECVWHRHISRHLFAFEIDVLCMVRLLCRYYDKVKCFMFCYSSRIEQQLFDTSSMNYSVVIVLLNWLRSFIFLYLMVFIFFKKQKFTLDDRNILKLIFHTLKEVFLGYWCKIKKNTKPVIFCQHIH